MGGGGIGDGVGGGCGGGSRALKICGVRVVLMILCWK